MSRRWEATLLHLLHAAPEALCGSQEAAREAVRHIWTPEPLEGPGSDTTAPLEDWQGTRPLRSTSCGLASQPWELAP
jgi:hypothetical protein